MAVHEMGRHRQCFFIRTASVKGSLDAMVFFNDNHTILDAWNFERGLDVSHLR